jgi:hypothetical protein
VWHKPFITLAGDNNVIGQKQGEIDVCGSRREPLVGSEKQRYAECVFGVDKPVGTMCFAGRRHRTQQAKQCMAFKAAANYRAAVATQEMSEGELATVVDDEEVHSCSDCAYRYGPAVIERDGKKYCTSGERLATLKVVGCPCFKSWRE